MKGIEIQGKISKQNECNKYVLPLDYSFKELESVADILHEQPNGPKRNSSNAKAFRLCYNKINNLDGLSTTLSKIIPSNDQVVWLDFSFNHLTHIDEVLKYPNLKVLYLHSNGIESLSQIDKLSNLVHLKNLTMHGNPVEQVKGYRHHVLSKLPQLRHLDFSAITIKDRERR